VVKTERLKEKYYLMVAQSFYMPKAIAEIKLHEQMDQVNASYVCVDYASIPDANAKITEADYKNYYEKNKHLFKQKASRAIDFVVFEVRPTEADLMEINKNVESLYGELQTEPDIQDFVNTVSIVRFDSIYMSRANVYPGWDSILFNAAPGATFAPRQMGKTFQMAKLLDIAIRPDSVKVSHILISHKEAGSQLGRTKAQAKILADSLQGVLSKNIAEFATLAQKYSEDPSVKQNGGDLAWQKEGFFIKPFNDAILKGNVGSVSVIESQNGYHILYVTGKTAPVKKVLAAVICVPIEPSAQTTKAVYTSANRFAAENRSLSEFNAAIQKQGLQKRSSEYTEELTSALPGLNSARDLVRWAFKKETKVGTVAKEIFEYENKYVIAVLREIREDGYMSLASIKKNPQVEYVVRRDKKAEQLIKQIEGMGKITSLEALATKEKTVVDSANAVGFMAYGFGNKGYEPELVGRMFGMKVNQISKPLQGNAGVFVIQMNAITPMNPQGSFGFIEEQAKNAFEQGM
ncbi:MAG: peptidylprolyl isomerase, partial [Bacteroidales bacterium]